MGESPSILTQFGSAASVAIRGFFVALLVFLVEGLTLAAASYYLLQDRTGWAVLAGLLALAEGMVAGVLVGLKRAIGLGLVHCVISLGLARSVLGVVCEQLLGISACETPGRRGGSLAQTLERIPLAQAEQRLNRAVAALLRGRSEHVRWGWLGQRLETQLLHWVKRCTLADFRRQDAAHGGVDLLELQTGLGERIDNALAARLRRGITIVTWIGVVLLAIAVVGQDYLMLSLLKR